MTDEFRLEIDPNNPNWIDVIYPDGPKYMIDVRNWRCTCLGDTIKKSKLIFEIDNCKHLKELADKTKIVG